MSRECESSNLQRCKSAFFSEYDMDRVKDYALEYLPCFDFDEALWELSGIDVAECTGERWLLHPVMESVGDAARAQWLSQHKEREDIFLKSLYFVLEKCGARHLSEEEKECFIEDCSIFYGELMLCTVQEILEIYRERGEGTFVAYGTDRRITLLPKYIKISADLIKICIEQPERFVHCY